MFLNGKPIGSHVGGFAAFSFDVTGLLRLGEDNVLAVKVSYRSPIPSIPLSGDYTKYPGLYRDMHLYLGMRPQCSGQTRSVQGESCRVRPQSLTGLGYYSPSARDISWSHALRNSSPMK